MPQRVLPKVLDGIWSPETAPKTAYDAYVESYRLSVMEGHPETAIGDAN